MKLPDKYNEIECYCNHTNHRYYYASPYQGQWDVIESPSPRGIWNTANISLAVVKDLRMANFIAHMLSKVGSVTPTKAKFGPDIGADGEIWQS